MKKLNYLTFDRISTGDIVSFKGEAMEVIERTPSRVVVKSENATHTVCKDDLRLAQRSYAFAHREFVIAARSMKETETSIYQQRAFAR